MTNVKDFKPAPDALDQKGIRKTVAENLGKGAPTNKIEEAFTLAYYAQKIKV